MFRWMRDRLAEAWHKRKISRAAESLSLILSSDSAHNPKRNNTMLTPVTPAQEHFSITIISLEGDVLGISVRPDYTVRRIKIIAMKHFYGQDASKPALQYSLIHSSKLKQLIDDSTMIEEEIHEYDELILKEIRIVTVKENLSEEALKGPNEEEIAWATNDLVVPRSPRPMPLTECPVDFQVEIRKILITLVRASARILIYSPDAQRLYDIVKEKLETRRKPPSDPKILKTLTEMGYSRKKILKALRLRKSSLVEALKWLIEHEDDDEDDDNEDGEGRSDNWNDDRGGDDQTSRKEENLLDVIDLLLENFRRYRKLDFKPNPKAMQSLLEMGFEEKNVIGALKITGNDRANACEWLLGERRRSLQDLDEGLDSDGAIYKAIMNNPHIQLSLTNPKMLLAYLSILETPASTNIWINDPEVSPVLSQIYKTYHAEKHAIHVNRYAVD